MAQLKLEVTGMTCDHCKSKVEDALNRVPGAYAVLVDLERGDAEVDHTGESKPEDFLTAVEQAGYGAKVAE